MKRIKIKGSEVFSERKRYRIKLKDIQKSKNDLKVIDKYC
jgi:hypothetical protein